MSTRGLRCPPPAAVSYAGITILQTGASSAGVRLFFVQPFDQSCWTGVGALGAAFATDVMVARLRTINAARIKYVIERLHLFSRARCPAPVRHMDAFTR
jgi:hypothetical protein